MNQIVFSDVDGTLLNDKHEITPLTQKAIQELKTKDIPFVIVSARSPSGISSIFKKYSIQGTIIAYSGALIMDDQDQIIYSQSMDVRYAVDIIEYIEKEHLDLSWCVYSYDQWLVKDCQDPRIKNEENIVEVKSSQMAVDQLSQLTAIHKILCICNPQETLSIKQKLKERFDCCTISQSSDCLIEIMDCGVHKGLAVKKLCELWQIPLTNTIAFGDQYNDLEMLKTVKYGFAMGNAPKDIQKQINRITLDNNHDGIYHALVKLNIIHHIENKMNYDRFPETKIKGYDQESFGDSLSIRQELKKISQHIGCLVVDCYPGVDDEILRLIQDVYQPEVLIKSEDIFYDKDKLNEMMKPHLTEDRVRGVMYYGKMEDFVDKRKLEEMKKILSSHGRILIYGVGASLISKGDTLIYCDLARWEIQLRYRAGMPNFKQDNNDEDPLKKIKRGFFIEWRIADKHKMNVFEKVDYFIDSNQKGQPKMVTGQALRAGLKQISCQPFRLVPYFDPGVWGGQWMKKVCGLDENEKNFAWSFDGVPEENSLYLRYGQTRIEIPAMDLVLYQPKELLGMKNYCRFGAEFPIRFDFLDTIGGQNLSLQVHPLTEYIKSHFGMTYTQDESYYILDCKEGGGVYLGLKDNISPEKMIEDLNKAQSGQKSFDADQYVNFFEAKKHDHFLIPAGTVHCSSANCMVLEISATPYIFTFKLWDWDRLGLDGLPRPIHIQDGEQNIQWDRTTKWVKDHLINNIEMIHEGKDYTEEKTGLHELEFIETRRYTFKEKTYHNCEDGFHMLNLVEGSAAIIESPHHMFEPFIVHYAETFILPSAAKAYTIRPYDCHETIKVIKAYVRH